MRFPERWGQIVGVPLLTIALQSCAESGYVYRRDIGPMAWSEDGHFIYFAYSDGKTNSILKTASQPGKGQVETITQVDSPVMVLQAWKGKLIISSKKSVFEYDLESRKSTAVEIPGETIVEGVYGISGGLVYLSSNNGDSRLGLFDRERQTRTTLDSRVSIIAGDNLKLSPDRRWVAYAGESLDQTTNTYSSSWKICYTGGGTPPVRSENRGGILGWLSSEQLLGIFCSPTATFCRVESNGRSEATEFANYSTHIYRSPAAEIIATSTSRPVAFEPWEGHNTLVLVKPNGADPKVLVAADQLPRGEMVWNSRPN